MSHFFDQIKIRFSQLLTASPCFSNDAWTFHIIINPRAGTFSRAKGQAQFLKQFDHEFNQKYAAGEKNDDIQLNVHCTDAPGHASLIAVQILDSCRAHNKRIFIMSIGGDGTHQEVFSGFMACEASLRARLLAFRFPAGTGNDAADAWNMGQAISAIRDGCPVAPSGAIEFKAPGREIRYAFNIASIGIDAYIVHLTNKLKSRLPGDFYKPLTNLGVLFYELIHGIHTMSIDIYRHDAPIHRLQRKNGIVAIGVSGWRTYGSEKWVLPGEDNLCAIEKGGILRNLQIKRHLFKASHTELPFTFMASTNRLVIAYPGRIPLQLDGEVLWLDASDFPMEFHIIETGIMVLSAKQSAKQQAYTHDYLKALR